MIEGSKPNLKPFEMFYLQVRYGDPDECDFEELLAGFFFVILKQERPILLVEKLLS